MATYRSIADSETDPKAPVTSELMKALALNPIAIMEGQSGAPRLAEKIQIGRGTDENWTTISNLSTGGGVYVDWFAICTTSTEPSTQTGSIQFEISTDGSTFTNTTTIAITGATNGPAQMNGSFYFDFASGGWQSAYSQLSGPASSTANIGSGTISGGPHSIVSIRFRALGYQTSSQLAVMCRLQGGNSAA